MRIPSTLKIGAHNYVVIRAPLLDKRGLHDPCARTITLDTDIDGTTLGATLIHEILHAINSELDHALLDSLAEQLFQVLHDNSLLAE